jgi:hypothetical protein
MKALIGRHLERKQLEDCLNSDRSEFVILYGRRRIGKTYLVNEHFKDRFTFRFAGSHDQSKEKQLDNFAHTLKKTSKSAFAPKLNDWDEAFRALENYIESLDNQKKKIIFFDEMPWIDTPKSGFVTALEYFWNDWASLRDDILFIACGSATSWIVEKILKNRGGLHCRTTAEIYLRPFQLGETEEFLKSKGFSWDRFQIAQTYMILGGVPFYYTLLDRKLSLTQNIDRLFFSSNNAALKVEFTELFASLFKKYEKYLAIMNTLSERQEGFTRSEISQKTGFVGAGLTDMLEDLERCDFIIGYSGFKGGKNNIIYRICDFYTLFFYRFVNNNRSKDTKYWENLLDNQKIASWQGFSFELLCLLHLEKIKDALGIGGISTESSTWRSKDKTAQIDLVIKRADRIVNICEIKFSKNQYAITPDYDLKLRNRMGIFKAETNTRYGVNTVFITTYGVQNAYNHSIVSGEVVLDDLF